MATTGTGIELAKAGTGALELSGQGIPEVTRKEYRAYSHEALDAEIVESVNEAHEHYNGLRRELVMRLLPALAEMRKRHGAQGSRNDLNTRLGLPRRAGWEDYLRARGLRPDTVRNWFQKYAAARTLGHLVSGTRPKQPTKGRPVKSGKQEAGLYKVSTGKRTLIVAATSADDALVVAGRVVGVCVSGNPRVKVKELGAAIELSASEGFEQVLPIQSRSALPPHRSPEAHEEERDRAELDVAIMTALRKNPSANHKLIAERFKITTVTLRRIAVRHGLAIGHQVQSLVPTSRSVNVSD